MSLNRVTLYKIDGPKWMQDKSEEDITFIKSQIMDGLYVYEGESILDSVTHVIKYSGEILTRVDYLASPTYIEEEE